MSITLKEFKKPIISKVKFECDDIIHEKLKEFELTKEFLNESNTTILVGKQKSGKTSLLINIVNKIYKKCFHHIYVFMPTYSRKSLKDNIFDKHLDPSKIYEKLDYDTIHDVYEKIKQNSERKERSLLILDDVQKALKDVSVLDALLNIIANQRHLRCVNLIMVQNFIALDPKIRDITNNVILFKLGKRQTKRIFDEVVESAKDKFDIIRDFVFDKPFNWMFINTSTQRIFKLFDEVIYTDDD
jgi:DNA replication protein DnaC